MSIWNIKYSHFLIFVFCLFISIDFDGSTIDSLHELNIEQLEENEILIKNISYKLVSCFFKSSLIDDLSSLKSFFLIPLDSENIPIIFYKQDLNSDYYWYQDYLYLLQVF